MAFEKFPLPRLSLILALALPGCGDDSGGDATSDDTGTAESDSTGDSTTSDATSNGSTDEGSTSADASGSSSTGDDSGTTSSADSTSAATDESGSDTASIDCSPLDETACAEQAECTAIEGAEVIMFGETYCYSTVPTFLGCRAADQGCAEVETFACENVEITTTYYFPDACVPDGWLTDGCPNADPPPEECIPM